MKPRWPYILLAVSLAANAVEVAVAASRLWRESRQQPAWMTALPSTALRPLMGLNGPEFARLDRRYRIVRHNNFYPDTAAIRAAHDQLEHVRREMYWLVFRSTRALKDASPAQRRLAERQWRMMTGLPADSSTSRPRR